MSHKITGNFVPQPTRVQPISLLRILCSVVTKLLWSIQMQIINLLMSHEFIGIVQPEHYQHLPNSPVTAVDS